MGKMPSRQVAHAVAPSCSTSSPSRGGSGSSRAKTSSSKLPPASSHSNSLTAGRGAHHHSQYKSDVGRFVYYFLREHPPAAAPSSSSNQSSLDSGDSSPNSARLVRKQPCQPHQLVHRAGAASSPETMPRRKSTKKIIINASPTSSDGEKEPHTSFRSNGSPIISPRLIRNSLRDSKFELDGTDDDDAAMTNGGNTPNGYSGREPEGPKRKVARSNGLKTAKGEDAMVAAQAAREAELAMNLEAEKAMTGLSGVQLWVHRLLMAHNQTLTSFDIERRDFPNTRLSLKQTEAVLNPIVTLCNVMRADHFGIHVPTPQIARTMKDVHYWKLWESDTIDIGIFFMPPNSVIPLHNHPGMCVVTRVLYGSAKVSSFDLISEPENPDETPEESAEMVVSDKSNVKWARVSREGEVGTESTLWLDPRRFNLHEIQANSTNGCALLDIMVPPYDNADRDCHHFKVLEEKIMGDQRIVKMLESIMPDNHNAPSDNNSTASSSPTMS